MLENLNNDLCVSKFMGRDSEQWACYEPNAFQPHGKRQSWKRITGLMSTESMHRYLGEHYPDQRVADEFTLISTHTRAF